MATAPEATTKVSWLRLALEDGVPRRSAVVAVIVGTILNIINQGDVMMAGEPLDYLKLALTFAVPYGVATYGAVSVRRYEARASGD